MKFKMMIELTLHYKETYHLEIYKSNLCIRTILPKPRNPFPRPPHRQSGTPAPISDHLTAPAPPPTYDNATSGLGPPPRPPSPLHMHDLPGSYENVLKIIDAYETYYSFYVIDFRLQFQIDS